MVHVAGDNLKSILVQAQGGRPPIFVFLAHFWIKIFGTSESAARSLSALAGIGALAAMYAVARHLFGTKVGLISTFLMAISEFQIYNAQNFRYYSLFVFLTLLSFLFFIRALAFKRMKDFAAYVLISILMFYTHTYGVFVLTAQVLYLLLRWSTFPERRKKWIVSQFLILIGICPGLFLALQKTTAGTGAGMNWIPDPPLWLPLRDLLYYVFPSFYYFHPSWNFICLNALAGIAFFLMGAFIFTVLKGKAQWGPSRRSSSTDIQSPSSRKDEIILVALWLLCPVVIPYAVSKVVGNFYFFRYTICSSPAFYLLLGLGIASLEKAVPKVISLVTLLILIVPGLHYFYATDFNEPWRKIAAYVEKNASENDVVIIVDYAKKGVSNAFSWYYRGPLQVCSLQKSLSAQEAIAEKVSEYLLGKDHFWLILRNPRAHILKDPSPFIRRFFFDSNRSNFCLEEEQKYRWVSVCSFSVAKEVF